MTRNLLLPIVLLTLSGGLSRADEGPSDEDVRQIQAEVAAYVEAFNAKDAAALAEHWSESGVYVRPADGTRLAGRKAIEKQFLASFAKDPQAVLVVKVDTIRFVTGEVAIEEGTAEVTWSPDTLPSRTGYSAVHVKRAGQWQIDSIREIDLPPPEETASNRLEELAWLVGDWADQSEEATVETSVVWTKNKTFLSYTFRISAGSVDELEGTQVVGYDPLAKAIRSWMFDSDGGFGEGVWSREENRWLVKFRQILADGRTASSTNVYTHVDADTFTWQSVEREVDGEPVADVEPVTLVRKPAADSLGLESN
jgi:uncharacterized protein (TIGR02246 family)